MAWFTPPRLTPISCRPPLRVEVQSSAAACSRSNPNPELISSLSHETPPITVRIPVAMASVAPLSPIVRHSELTSSFRLEMSPGSRSIWRSMLPAKWVLPMLMRWRSISEALLPTWVVTPLKVNATLSPSARALMPNSFRRSNSPTVASATVSTICIRSLLMAAAVLP